MKNVSFSAAGIYMLMVLIWLAIIFGLLFVGHFSLIHPTQKTINILTWGSIFDTSTISSFTKRTGIKVNVSYYSTNEELLVALKSTKGSGYDLIVPSDYAVPILKEQGLLKKLDKSRLTFLSNLNPLLTARSFDPTNDYSLPYMVEIFGLGYSKSFFGGSLPNPSWHLIFTKPAGFKIAMVNDPVEAIDLAAYYLFKQANRPLTAKQIESVKQLLVTQKAWVEAYTDFRPDYFLLTGNCPLVVTQLSSVIRAQEQSSDIGFALPHEGTFMSIENLAIPTGSHNNAVYDFINYVYTPPITISHFEKLASVPATSDVLSQLQFKDDLQKTIISLLTMDRDQFEKFALFFAPIMPENTLHNLWVEVKS